MNVKHFFAVFTLMQRDMVLFERQVILKINLSFLFLLILRIIFFELSIDNPSELALITGFSSHPFLGLRMVLLSAKECGMTKSRHSKTLFKRVPPSPANKQAPNSQNICS